MHRTIATTVSAILLTAASSSARAEALPVVAGIRLGSIVGVEIPLCAPAAPPKYAPCSDTDSLCKRQMKFILEAFQDVIPPTDGSMCFGTNRPLPTNGRSTHWVVNAKKLKDMQVGTVHARDNRIDSVVLNVNYGIYESARNADQTLSRMLTEKTARMPEVLMDIDRCSGEGHNQKCVTLIHKKWETADVRYQLRLGAVGGSLVIEAKFADTPEDKYEPIFSK